jgi:hypothetical protein
MEETIAGKSRNRIGKNNCNNFSFRVDYMEKLINHADNFLMIQ